MREWGGGGGGGGGGRDGDSESTIMHDEAPYMVQYLLCLYCQSEHQNQQAV